jgi:hypothetical protein
MTNDAKLGMVAGVAGVIVAAVLLSGNPPPAAQSKPGAPVEPGKKDRTASQPQVPSGTAPTAAVTPAPTEAHAALPSTPIPRTRKDVDAQPASRPGGTDEEP